MIEPCVIFNEPIFKWVTKCSFNWPISCTTDRIAGDGCLYHIISPMIEMEVLEVLLTQLEWTFYRYLDVDRVAEMKDIPIHTSSWRDCIVKILTRSKRSSGCRVWPPECCYKMGIHI